MSLLQVNTYAMALSRITTFHVLLPNDLPPEMKKDNPHYDRPVKTLYLLHGFSANHMDWMLGSQIQELSGKYNLAVVMPSGENSFYLNGKGTGRAYETYTAVELVNYCRNTFGLSDKKEDTFIGGLSMGGFGALHTALKYPETFGKVFALSSALIVNEIKKMKPGSKNVMADYDYYFQTFGELDKLDHSENNPEYVVEERLKKGDTIQPVYMACGTEDFLINENHEFRDFLIGHGVALTYKESTGVHDWKFWNEYLEPAIVWALAE